MQYIKFTQLDSVTGISTNRQTSKNGPVFPSIDGLEILFQCNYNTLDWFGTCPDSYEADTGNQQYILTLQEFAEEVKRNIDKEIESRKNDVYSNEKSVRDQLMGKYHVTSALSSIYKYEQALELIENTEAEASEIRLEASIRGVTPLEIANMVITLHEEFRNIEAIITGIRGKLHDQLEAFQVNMAEPLQSYQEFHSTETIGIGENAVEVQKYGTDIMARLNVIISSMG